MVQNWKFFGTRFFFSKRRGSCLGDFVFCFLLKSIFAGGLRDVDNSRSFFFSLLHNLAQLV